MKLAAKEIQHIDEILTERGLDYIDLKYEILDHMANGIEALMVNEDLSFEEASSKELKNWEQEFKPYSHFLFGYAQVGPKIVIKRCVNLIKQMYLKSIIGGMLIAFGLLCFFKLIPTGLNTDGVNFIAGFVYTVSTLVALYFLYLATKFQTKSTCQYFLKVNGRTHWIALFLFNPFWEWSVKFDVVNSSFLDLFWPSAIIIMNFFMIKTFFDHKKTTNYQIV
ncbi:hypothetical protein [Cellulophaga lytica]|uniref:Uncharacterized protein n=1 Tax=Cellulophaga lytica (strain ATCC 23178 / DSM 7489 / JCM 8516 / NBRC 14961 / NCIMB 1423 / VKM B-1433 / Cy l20) TaxID=867900 RepID=F0RHU2_CELLC|nr:hypothetical protein [Cellulophaga lytica]ADY29204.1 hypothetical protein Celly_1379 [Cellulophaga lytica DSM 7489]WQG76621.1 hypothetical protein SR888_13090 [Cellulophaga lytica]